MDNPCTQWLTETSWDNITELDKYELFLFESLSKFLLTFLLYVFRLPNFHGIVTSFEQYPRDWNQWYTSAEPENTPLPGK